MWMPFWAPSACCCGGNANLVQATPSAIKCSGCLRVGRYQGPHVGGTDPHGDVAADLEHVVTQDLQALVANSAAKPVANNAATPAAVTLAEAPRLLAGRVEEEAVRTLLADSRALVTLQRLAHPFCRCEGVLRVLCQRWEVPWTQKRGVRGNRDLAADL